MFIKWKSIDFLNKYSLGREQEKGKEDDSERVGEKISIKTSERASERERELDEYQWKDRNSFIIFVRLFLILLLIT